MNGADTVTLQHSGTGTLLIERKYENDSLSFSTPKCEGLKLIKLLTELEEGDMAQLVFNVPTNTQRLKAAIKESQLGRAISRGLQ